MCRTRFLGGCRQSDFSKFQRWRHTGSSYSVHKCASEALLFRSIQTYTKWISEANSVGDNCGCYENRFSCLLKVVVNVDVTSYSVPLVYFKMAVANPSGPRVDCPCSRR